jgi:hypothetical protein
LPPALTGVGRKLNANWLKRVLQSTGDIRPHLRIRMPKYPAGEVEPLVPLLAAADAPHTASTTGSTLSADVKLAAAGRAIFNLGCVQCHPVRGEALSSVVGVDVGHIGARVRRDWFDDFLLDPASLKARTRMPTFFAEGSVNKDILEGNVEKQIAALWAYLEDIDRQPLPEKIEQVRRQNFELIPKDRPVVLRTFMDQAGTHAIAVGFVEKVNYAFDAESVRLAEVWSGRFLDAQGTWNDRFTPPAVPLSLSRAALASGQEFAHLSSIKSPWPVSSINSASKALTDSRNSIQFLGYRLDKFGTPEFQYRLGDYSIVDRLEPIRASDDTELAKREHGLTRELTVSYADTNREKTKPPGQLWFRAAADTKPLRRDADSCVTDSGLTVSLPPELVDSSVVRELGGQSVWLVPMPAVAETKLIIEYRW